jgi:two-component system NarL family sensor kinase
MKLRYKIILFSITPLLLALGAISATVSYQADSLAQQEQKAIRKAYMETKDSELVNYVEIAKLAISDLYESGRSDAATQEAAKAILEKLEYSKPDGYFFLYSLDSTGTLLMHPKQRDKVGMSMIAERDKDGNLLIRDMIEIAKKGDGFYNYIYPKFSTSPLEDKPKRAYVVGLPNWGWMLGTGVYLDDIDAALAEADKTASNNIKSTMLWILAITALSLLLIIFLGLALNIWEQRDNLEKARKRIARELHDGVCQKLGAIKYHMEASMLKLINSTQDTSATQETLGEMAGRIAKVNVEIRSIAHELHAKILTDFRLEPAIRQLANDYPDTPISFYSEGEVNNLPIHAERALYRIAQTGLDNIQKHAKASQVTLRLEGEKHYVILEIADDGVGFDFKKYKSKEKNGLGLQSIKERVEDERVDGKLTIRSSPAGTTLIARVPRKPRNIFWITFFPWKNS